MQAKPASAVIKGIVIDPILGFRYGQQIKEQLFFELRFRQPLFGAPFSVGADNAGKYIYQPITLNFEGALNKIKPISGTITRLEFINNPGQQAEVIVSGTMYHPSRYFSKFTLCLAALLLLPVLFIGGLLSGISYVSDGLVKTEGSVALYQDRSSKGFHRYTFNIAPYRAQFYRKYHRPLLNTPIRQIDEIFTVDGQYNPDMTGQKVSFYIFKSDKHKLFNAEDKIDFFYLKSQSRQRLSSDYHFDLLVYITNKSGFYFVWLSYLLLEVFCFVSAYYCYRMYALQQQKRNRMIWMGSLTLVVLLNIVVLAIII